MRSAALILLASWLGVSGAAPGTLRYFWRTRTPEMAGEGDSPRPALPKVRARAATLPGGHHFGGDSATLAHGRVGFMGL